MRSSTTTTLVEPPVNRRQPVRQTRINPSRAAAAAAGTNAAAGAPTSHPPGFFPGITHFTDTLTALPKEMIRHYTMIREVDVKIFGPEETLKTLMATIPARPPPDGADEAAELAYRQHFLKARYAMMEMLPSLDEKNHALAMANDTLERLEARCNSAWPAIENEISEEAKWGRLDHWAYTDRTVDTKKATVMNERTRREVAIANTMAAAATANSVDAEAGSSRADTRGKSRKAVAAAHMESEQEDPRLAKRVAANNKRTKPSDFQAANGGGMVNGAGTTANKRRKVEKPAANNATGGVPVERSLSAVFGPTARARASPRETPAPEGPRKKGRGGQAATGTTGRRRAGTVNSSVNSPNPTSSPIVSTFPAAAKGGASPALGSTSMQRTPSARLRQASAAQAPPQTNKPLPTAAEPTTSSALGLGISNDKPKPAAPSAASDKTNKTEETKNPEPETRTSARATAMKREDSSQSRRRPPSISTVSRAGNGKASKAATPVGPSFPEAGSAPNNASASGSGNGNGNGGSTTNGPAPRAVRGGNGGNGNGNSGALGANHTTTAFLHFEPPVKRSHKKGQGIQALAAQQHVLQAASSTRKGSRGTLDGASSEPGDGDDDDGAADEPRYCYCNGLSYGQMVACDNESCEREWFHLQCAGLTRPPTQKMKWYCNDCKKKLR